MGMEQHVATLISPVAVVPKQTYMLIQHVPTCVLELRQHAMISKSKTCGMPVYYTLLQYLGVLWAVALPIARHMACAPDRAAATAPAVKGARQGPRHGGLTRPPQRASIKARPLFFSFSKQKCKIQYVTCDGKSMINL